MASRLFRKDHKLDYSFHYLREMPLHCPAPQSQTNYHSAKNCLHHRLHLHCHVRLRRSRFLRHRHRPEELPRPQRHPDGTRVRQQRPERGKHLFLHHGLCPAQLFRNRHRLHCHPCAKPDAEIKMAPDCHNQRSWGWEQERALHAR